MSKQYVVFSGDRACVENESIKRTLATLDKDKHIIVQGGCSGVDRVVLRESKGMGFEVITVNANWEKYGHYAGPIRNEKMINDYNPVKVYLFHDHIEQSKGTKNMRNLCKKYKVDHEVIKIKQPHL